MKLRLLLPLMLATSVLHGTNQVGFIEKFALAPDREKVLTELVPGTDEYYFFHALHFQNTRQAAKLQSMLDAWKSRIPASPQRQIIENREVLLAYDADPQRTLDFLKKFCKLSFHHVQVRRDQKPNLPTRLDPSAIDWKKFLEAALQSNDISRLHPDALARLIAEKVDLRPAQRRHVLAGIQIPKIPGLVEFIAADLKSNESRGFGEFAIHRHLLPDQLDALVRLIPALSEDTQFVNTRLRKLLPGNDADLQTDLPAREAWLERSLAYARTLPPSYDNLKAALLRQRLELDQARGLFSKDLFLEYLKLPRRTGYVNPRWIEAPGRAPFAFDPAAETGSDIESLRRGMDDEPLVRSLFLSLFATEDDWQPYAAYVRDTWLKRVFAEAKITAGIGEPEKWASLITPAEYKALRDRVDIDFPTNNRPQFAPGDDISIDVWLKNTPQLIVKIYEINARACFLEQQRELNTDLPLDGLIANSEATHAYDDPPTRRVKRTFKFPELKGRRGAWMIEFIGGGRSSRALLRTGHWHVVETVGPAGMLLFVLDEKRQVVRDAVIWADNRRFTVDQKLGGVVIPFTHQPGTKHIVVTDAADTFATLAKIHHHDEAYALDARFHIEREQLLSRRKATLAMDARLLLHGTHLPLSLLKEPRLTISTTTHEGITTTQSFSDLKLDVTRHYTLEFPVPDRIATIALRLSAKIDQLTKGGEKLELVAEENLSLNRIDETASTFDAFLTRIENDWVVELRGRNGEPVPDYPLRFQAFHTHFPQQLAVQLRTDENGRVFLGALPEIKELLLTDPPQHWSLATFDRTWSGIVQGIEGEEIKIPLLKTFDPAAFSVFEERDGVITADVTRSVPLIALGADRQAVAGKAQPAVQLPYLPLNGLPAGTYLIHLPGEGRTLRLELTKGSKQVGWAFGGRRALTLSEPDPLTIPRVDVLANEILVYVNHTDPATTVQIAASRYVHPEGTMQKLMRRHTTSMQEVRLPYLPNLYAAGRDIGDEFRYILDRRYTQKFPGNMLPRPGLLLNPWEKRTTDQSSISMKSGTAPAPVATPAPMSPMNRMRGSDAAKATAEGDHSTRPNLAFLAVPGAAIYNLVPDQNGIARIDRATLGDRHLVQILARNLQDAVWRQIVLPASEPKLEDQRLLRNLDPAKTFTQQSRTTVLAAGQGMTLPDARSSQVESYATLRSVFSLMQALSTDSTLPAFAWILDWPTLGDEEKRARYSEFACHEVHLFLSRKDPAFFKTVIEPYLRSKRDKTFLDDYLLGADLRPYTDPWTFDRLNAMERALLASRLPEEAAAVARKVREQWEMLPINPSLAIHYFDSALRGLSLADHGLGNALPALSGEPANRAEALDAAKEFSGIADLSHLGRDSLKREVRRAATEEEAEKSLFRLAAAASSTNFALDESLGVERDRAMGVSYYRRLGPAREWAENNYYKLPIHAQDSDLITVNQFWRDFAGWTADGAKGPFLSPHFPEACGSLAEMLCALAVLDLPFDAPKIETNIDGAALTLTSNGPSILFHRQIVPAPVADPGSLLISQNFYRHGERHRNEGNEKFDKYVTGEFLAGVVYGANVVITNPGSAPQNIELLLQVPKGAVPVLRSKATDSRRERIEPFTTKSFEYAFYFPTPNTADEVAFPHYPATVAKEDAVIAAAKPVVFRVVAQLSELDTSSWEYVSQYGTEADVFAFLDQRNLLHIDLTRIAWRCRESREFYRKLIVALEKRHHFDSVIYSYSVHHHDAPTLRKWLRYREDLIAECGPQLVSNLLRIDPIEQRSFEHLEYSPLVNQRAHRLGSEDRIADNVVLAQYQSFLRILAHKASPDANDAMSVTYFLLLQDRVEEGLAWLRKVDAGALSTRIQYDYFRCYAAMYEGNLAQARGIASQHAGHPVARWRSHFTQVLTQLHEIDGQQPIADGSAAGPDRERETARAADAQPVFDFKVENRAISLTWRHLAEVTVNYYLIDPEFSFSSSPFVGEDGGRFSLIKPIRSATVPLPADKDSLEVSLPAEFARANVVVEITAAGQRRTRVYHANSLKLNLAENYGRLELRDATTDRAVSKAYVKVYARMNNGTVRFYKDGYTDLRGKFDYASLNSSDAPVAHRPMPATESSGSLDHQMLAPGELGQVSRLAILVMSEEQGAMVREVVPPAQ